MFMKPHMSLRGASISDEAILDMQSRSARRGLLRTSQ